MSKYAWAGNSFLSGNVDPEIAAIELERIRAAHDGLRPKEIVDEARSVKSPLHPAFEWDDFEAAEAHRRWQARCLVRSIRVVVDDDVTQPIYVSIATGENRHYEAVSVVVQDVDLFSEALGHLKGKIGEIQHSIDELVSLAPQPKKRAVQRAAKAVSQARESIEKV